MQNLNEHHKKLIIPELSNLVTCVLITIRTMAGLDKEAIRIKAHDQA